MTENYDRYINKQKHNHQFELLFLWYVYTSKELATHKKKLLFINSIYLAFSSLQIHSYRLNYTASSFTLSNKK